ncbi:hypothetical protein GQX74_002335 [Glossina fuscipes]|nr:hypothetical protein GQX74_002335 [Glossina fuscipes]
MDTIRESEENSPKLKISHCTAQLTQISKRGPSGSSQFEEFFFEYETVQNKHMDTTREALSQLIALIEAGKNQQPSGQRHLVQPPSNGSMWPFFACPFPPISISIDLPPPVCSEHVRAILYSQSLPVHFLPVHRVAAESEPRISDNGGAFSLSKRAFIESDYHRQNLIKLLSKTGDYTDKLKVT